ncbi:MAG TPA: aspartate kinase [Salinimicrobium sp.]|nr:aspartate kinase [Salinimicrobium sp.]
MKIYKFGGASVKDATGVKNLLKVLESTGSENLLIIISAMGKTTNAMEIVVSEYLETGTFNLNPVQEYHYQILNGLFDNKNAIVFSKVEKQFAELKNFLTHNKSTQYDFVYDQVVSFGELISTKIVSEYLNENGLENRWMDARSLVKTDERYRYANVLWDETRENIVKAVNGKLIITQGFIGADSNNFTTTLGREGSDYSAAIFGSCLNAEKVVIWKDVPGILNADPRVFADTRLLSEISYEEAIELAFYGASVIHPKTLQPLEQKEIPLHVKSFLNPTEKGSVVCKMEGLNPWIPCFIVKQNQVLISLRSLNFSFMAEENLGEIFKLFHSYQIKVNMIQNSAITFSVCVDDNFNNLEPLIQHLKAKFKVDYIKDVSLYTIRHYNVDAVKQIEASKEILIKQISTQTFQIVAKA